jgi:hypothetical protein
MDARLFRVEGTTTTNWSSKIPTCAPNWPISAQLNRVDELPSRALSSGSGEVAELPKPIPCQFTPLPYVRSIITFVPWHTLPPA